MRHDLLQENIKTFAKLCIEHGWTREETLKVVKAARDEIRYKLARRSDFRVIDILKKHAIPVIERKKREQEQ